MALAIAVFCLSATAIIIAGTFLARSGDVIAARTRLGGLWVGSVFLALATSLPELATDIVAVRLGALDLAAGDLFGSSMANMLILGIIGIIPAGAGLFRKAALDHALYASLAIILTGIAAAAILAGGDGRVGWLGVGSIILLLVYGFGSWAAFRHSTVARVAGVVVEMSGDTPVEGDPASGARAPTLRRAGLTFLAASAAILLVAPRFARSADELATLSGLGTTVVGTALVGLATSLPELVTCVAAVRLKAYDLAVGNLFGSNALNMTVFVALDAAYGDGPFLSAISPTHAITGLVAIVMMGIAVAALVYRSQTLYRLREPSSLLLIGAYIVGLALVATRATAG
jgi:cation:H+ antiporter